MSHSIPPQYDDEEEFEACVAKAMPSAIETPYLAGLRDGAHKAAAIIRALAATCESTDRVVGAESLRALADTILEYRDDTGAKQG